MKVLAYNDDGYRSSSSAIVELSFRELEEFLGTNERPKVGNLCKPIERLELSNNIISRAASAKKTADQLRALAELIDTTVPGIDAIVNPPSEPKQERVFRCCSEGALVCDVEIPGLTQVLSDEHAQSYGGRFFVGETITKSAAKQLAEALGGRLEE